MSIKLPELIFPEINENNENLIHVDPLLGQDYVSNKNTNIDTSLLDVLSWDKLLSQEIPDVKKILFDMFNVNNEFSLEIQIRKSQQYYFSKCKNKVTSGGVCTEDLHEFNGISSEDGYCFDLSDLSKRFENGDFTNPFTNNLFTKEFVKKFKELVQKVSAKGNYSNILDAINYDTLQKIKLKRILSGSYKENEIKQMTKNFFNLDSKNLDNFIHYNLGIKEFPTFDDVEKKRKFALDTYILKKWNNLSSIQKRKNKK